MNDIDVSVNALVRYNTLHKYDTVFTQNKQHMRQLDIELNYEHVVAALFVRCGASHQVGVVVRDDNPSLQAFRLSAEFIGHEAYVLTPDELMNMKPDNLVE